MTVLGSFLGGLAGLGAVAVQPSNKSTDPSFVIPTLATQPCCPAHQLATSGILYFIRRNLFASAVFSPTSHLVWHQLIGMIGPKPFATAQYFNFRRASSPGTAVER